MISLSLRFIGHENHFNYRLALEIGLIIALAVSVSGAITGISGQFNSLLASTSGESTTFIGIEQGSSLENSNLPIELYESIDETFVNYKIVYDVDQITLLDNQLSFIYHTDLNDFFNHRTNAFVISGFLPNKTGDLLLGDGLAEELDITVFPSNISLSISNNLEIRQITGIVKDAGPWNFAFLGNITNSGSVNNQISGFEVQLKNSKVFEAFQNQVRDFIQSEQLGVSVEYLELKQVTNLSTSFIEELRTLFNYLLIFLFLLLALKIAHSSITLYDKLKRDYLLCRIIGMERSSIQRIFYYNIAITGNIGLIYGILLGITFPQLLVVLLKLFGTTQILNLLPETAHLLQIFILSNAIFFLSSFLVRNVKLNSEVRSII